MTIRKDSDDFAPYPPNASDMQPGAETDPETGFSLMKEALYQLDPYIDRSRAIDEGQNPQLDLNPDHDSTHPITYWKKQTFNAIPKDLRGCIANHHHAKMAIDKGQPHRRAASAANFSDTPQPPLPDTFAPVMLPESYDILTDPDPEPPPMPEPRLTPGMPASEVIHGAARDLTIVISVMSARLRHTIGFEADTQTIAKISELAFSLSKLHYILQQPKPKRPRGRPRKNPEKQK